MALSDVLGFAGDVAGIIGGQQANVANARMARKQRQWEERMSNTAVQRRKADLEAAGFNPMLAFMGSGVGGLDASTPPGASASGTQQNVAGGGFSKTLAAVLQREQIKSIQASTAKTVQEARKTGIEADVASEFSAKSAQQSLLETEGRVSKLAADIRAQNINSDRILQDIERGRLEIDQLKKLQPLLVEYQDILNRYTKAGIPEMEARNQIFKDYPGLKWIQLLREVMPRVSIGPR